MEGAPADKVRWVLEQEEVEVTMDPACRHDPRLACRARTAVLCAALALGGTGAAAAQPAAMQTVELTWKLEPGTDLVYRESQQYETELPQGMGTSSMRSGSTQRWSVLEVDGDGNATVRVTTEQVQMNLDGLMGGIRVDSAAQGGPGTFLDAVAGTSYTVVLDPRGVVIEMSGLEEMREALREQVQDLPEQVQDLPSLAMLDGMFSDEALRSQWAQGSLALPTEPVAVGSTWDSAFTSMVPGFGSTTVATSYRVESIDGDIVVIGSSGTMPLPGGALSSVPIPVQLGDTTMVEVGTSRFDAGKGLLLGTESTIRFDMTMAIGGQEMITETVITTTLELIERGD